MSLADRAKNIVPASERNRVCAFGRRLANMDDTERAAFHELAGKVASLTELSVILKAEGYPHDRHVLGRHLKGECSCDSQ